MFIPEYVLTKIAAETTCRGVSTSSPRRFKFSFFSHAHSWSTVKIIPCLNSRKEHVCILFLKISFD